MSGEVKIPDTGKKSFLKIGQLELSVSVTLPEVTAKALSEEIAAWMAFPEAEQLLARIARTEDILTSIDSRLGALSDLTAGAQVIVDEVRMEIEAIPDADLIPDTAWMKARRERLGQPLPIEISPA